MCRMLAYAGTPMPLAPLVFGGDHSLYRQSWAPRELRTGSVNADGYGVVWYADRGPGRIAEARPIWFDDGLESTLGVIQAPVALAALRNGTPGIPVDRSGLLPLLHERWSFVLNGFVPDFRARHMRELRAGLPDELYGALAGSSDSETLFLLAVGLVRDGATMSEALFEVARRVVERAGDDEAQLNMLMTDGSTVVAARTGNRLETNSLYISEQPPFAPGGIVVASEAPDPAGVWSVVDGHSIVRIGPDGTITTEPVIF